MTSTLPQNLPTEQEYETFRSKAREALYRAIAKGDTRCCLPVSWINSNVAAWSHDPILSYLVFSPDSSHPVGKRIGSILSDLKLELKTTHNVLVSYGGCNEGTMATLSTSSKKSTT